MTPIPARMIPMTIESRQPPTSNGFSISRNLNPSLVRIESLKPLGRETRKHPPAQVRKLTESLDRFGFVLPILVDGENRVVAGWGLILAARKLGLPDVPAVTRPTKIVQSWDVAMQTGETNDYSVCTTWRADRDDVYLRFECGAPMSPTLRSRSRNSASPTWSGTVRAKRTTAATCWRGDDL
jgi:hypothetical protein